MWEHTKTLQEMLHARPPLHIRARFFCAGETRHQTALATRDMLDRMGIAQLASPASTRPWLDQLAVHSVLVESFLVRARRRQIRVFLVQTRRTRVVTTRSASPVRQAHPRLPQAVRHRIASATWATRDQTAAIVRLVPQARTRQWLDQLNAYSALVASFPINPPRQLLPLALPALLSHPLRPAVCLHLAAVTRATRA